MFSKFFINRPIFATVLALLIVVAGLVTLGILPIAQYPDITPPTVQVSAVYPPIPPHRVLIRSPLLLPSEQISTWQPYKSKTVSVWHRLHCQPR